MTKTKKTKRQWTSTLRDFAASGKASLGKGGAPNKHTDAVFREAYAAIRQCPKHTGSGAIASAFAGNGGGGCTCEWHDGTHRLVRLYFPPQPNRPAQTTAPAPTAPARPLVEIPFMIPEVPKAKRSISDVANTTYTYTTKPTANRAVFDLTVFGHTEGKCPHCGGIPTTGSNLNGTVKIIHTIDLPRFVQGVGMTCSACNQTWQTYEKGYVDTLPKSKQMELNAVIVGGSDGVDMSLITMLRSGDNPANVERTCTANLHRWHNSLKDQYRRRCISERALGRNVVEREFPKVDMRWVGKAALLMKAFIRDYLSVRPELNREMASLCSEQSLAVDHQAKVVKHAKGGDAEGTFAILSDTGLVLGYYAVPGEDMKWVHLAMKEIVERHGGRLDPVNKHRLVERGVLPEVIYVDKDCCNGKEGGRNEENAYFYGMLKLLDAFHLICRIAREMNSEHNRKPLFLRQLSQCIFTRCEEDARRLDEARRAGGIDGLTSTQQKRDRQNYVRRVIANPGQIASKVLVLLKSNIAMDREAMRQFEASGESCQNLTPAHDAYPLITKKVAACVKRQLHHIVNGCVADVNQVNFSTGSAEYRGTGVSLPTYKSGRGSNKVEALHSVMDRSLYARNNLRQIAWDAAAHWKVTNYNRKRLRLMNRMALPDSVAPSEDPDGATLVASTELRFGFDYCHYALNEMDSRIQEEVRAQLDSDTFLFDLADFDLENAMEEALDVPLADDAATDAAADALSLPPVEDAPPFLTEIPATVDLAALREIGLSLDQDLDLTNVPLQNIFNDEMESSGTTLLDCLHGADRMAADAGIDLTAADGRGDADNLLNLNVNGRRNVANRRAQNQQTPKVGPDFNPAMCEKWISIWTDPGIPQPRSGSASYYDWFWRASVSYEKFRLEELSAARRAGTTPPPLYPVTFPQAKKWVTLMRELSKEAHNQGVVNETTADIRTNLNRFVNTLNLAENEETFGSEGGMGAAVDVDTLETHVPAASQGPPVFESPTNAEVNATLTRGHDGNARVAESWEVLTEAPKRKKAKKQPISAADQLRMQRAADRLAELGTGRDTRSKDNSGKRICTICGKFWKDFSLVVDDEVIPHQIITEGQEGPQFRFCPLADDHSLYHQHKARKRSGDAKRAKKYRASK